MKKSCSRFYATMLILGLTTLALRADRGVFNPQATPSDLIIGGASTVKVTAEVGADPRLYISSVAVYQTTAAGQPIGLISQMYDDGTHGDVRGADTIFTADINVPASSPGILYLRVTVAYQGDRNRYMTPVVPVNLFARIPDNVLDAAIAELQTLEGSFLIDLLGGDDLASARQKTLQLALANPDVTGAELHGDDLSILYFNMVRGIAFLTDPSHPVKAGGSPTLPSDYRTPGNTNLLIFAPNVTSDGFRLDADHAQARFGSAAWMTFNPHPPSITQDAQASLEVIKQWGSYGTVVVDSHGGWWSLNGQNYVVLVSGTPDNAANRTTYAADLATNRIGVTASGMYAVYPSFVSAHCVPMVNTFFYLGACHSLHNDTMWNALSAKGAKVAFGWSETVGAGFDATTFAALIDPMLPTDTSTVPLTARQAFDGIANKCESADTNAACLRMSTASSEWDNFLFVGGGLVNGDFETGDWTGWVGGADAGDNYKIVAGARKHGGSFSAALGRWDTSYHGYDPTSEPYGYEWIYQDFVVPPGATYLKFDWWLETYDTALWDWFDAYIMNTSGTVLQTLVPHGGKPGSNYGPYWTTAMGTPVGGGISVGGGWYEVTANVSAYRGQKIRIYFDQRLDGYGDQQRVYIDDVRLE